MSFRAGDTVTITRDYAIDYRDCVDPKGLYGKVMAVKAGCIGVILVDEPSEFGVEMRFPVRFYDCDNYPCLVSHGEEIGAGHYIPYHYLKKISDKTFDGPSVSDLEELFA